MEIQRNVPVKFQREIGDIVTSFGRNIQIIDREIRPKTMYKNGNPFVGKTKYYKYKCLNCNNEDWIAEYTLGEHMHCGCNACCDPPKKVVVGVNDISTTAKWMVKYFQSGIEEAQKYTKCSNKYVDFICPDCGKKHRRRIKDVYAAKTLSCICSDSISYPNKYMYNFLEQLNIDFMCEKSFNWSDKRKYDFYFVYYGNTIIIEMNGLQHYVSKFKHSARTLEEEQANDIYKEKLAKENKVDYYFSIDCRNSDCNYIKNSIVNSDLLKILHITKDDIDWDNIAEIAASNFTKRICIYKTNHPELALSDIAEIFRISPKTVLDKVKIGATFGWCSYDVKESRQIKESQQRIEHGAKPIYCSTNDMYYRSSHDAEKALSTDERTFFSRQIRKAIQRGHNYLNHKFAYISREEFNEAKEHYPEKTVGNKFVIKE